MEEKELGKCIPDLRLSLPGEILPDPSSQLSADSIKCSVEL